VNETAFSAPAELATFAPYLEQRDSYPYLSFPFAWSWLRHPRRPQAASLKSRSVQAKPRMVATSLTAALFVMILKMLAAITILLILDSLKSNMKKMIGNCCLVNKKTLRIERRNHGFFVY
jgi:hypothetical protein